MTRRYSTYYGYYLTTLPPYHLTTYHLPPYYLTILPPTTYHLPPTTYHLPPYYLTTSPPHHQVLKAYIVELTCLLDAALEQLGAVRNLSSPRPYAEAQP